MHGVSIGLAWGYAMRSFTVESTIMDKTYQSEGAALSATSATPVTVATTTTDKPTRFDRFGIVLALLALYVIWGSTYLGMRFAIESFPPFLMVGIRFLIAGSLLYTFLRVRGAPAPTRAQWIGAAIVGTLLLVVGNGGVAFAEQWVASGVAAVAVAAVPLWTAFFIGLMGRWPTRIEWIGLILGFAGVVLLNFESNMWANPAGAIALLLGPICWALGTALSGRVQLPKGAMSSAAQMIVGGIITMLLALLLGERIHGMPSAQSLWAMGFLIIFGSLVAFSAFGYVIRKLRPALATSYAYVNPAVAVLLGISFDGEHITLTGIIAMLIILTGVGLVSLKHK